MFEVHLPRVRTLIGAQDSCDVFPCPFWMLRSKGRPFQLPHLFRESELELEVLRGSHLFSASI
jgi:hypothetical protein